MTQLLEWPTPPSPTPEAEFSDEQLMEMIQSHEHRGLALLHTRYAALLRTISMKVLHNDADSEDLLQDIFMEIWDRAVSYDPNMGRPLAWIATLARRRAIDRLRKRETYSRVEDRYADECDCHMAGWTHVHEDISHSEQSAIIDRALATLPEAQRNAIHLAFHQQMTQREIAAYTGIPLGTIKTRLELGLRKMAASLRGLEAIL
jgi:RNA polymerase sigma-70 factor (ECF subfamily)